MPHLNHRRGDTHQNVRNTKQRRYIPGYWNRCANRVLRIAVHQVLKDFKANACDPELAEEILFPPAHKIDSLWNYD